MQSTQIPRRRRSNSVEDIKGGERKRRRKALSCFICRSRKLKCDREYPACGRCRNAGQPQSCVYDSGPSETENVDESCFLPEEDSRTRGKGAMDLHRMARLPAPSDCPPSHNEMSSKLLLQAKQISHLETRLALLESTGALSSLGANELDPSALATTSTESGQRDLKSFEPMFFHGEAFSTQFGGASEATALFAHVTHHSRGRYKA